jgi:MFS family permease
MLPSTLRAWFTQTFAALRLRDFRILWIGTVLAHLAFFMSTVVQSVVAFELMGSNAAVGWVVFAQGVSMSLLGPLGGALADRWPKRLVVGASQSVPAAVFLGLCAATVLGSLQINLVAAGSFVLG